jgi:hypothetical protein
MREIYFQNIVFSSMKNYSLNLVVVVVVVVVVPALHHSLDVRTTVPSCGMANNVLGSVSKDMTRVRDARQVE